MNIFMPGGRVSNTKEISKQPTSEQPTSEQLTSGKYDNLSAINGILSSSLNGEMLCASYTFVVNDREERLRQFRAFFILLEGLLKKPIAAVTSQLGCIGHHWVLCYFIDKDNMLYVDPYGDSSDHLSEIAQKLGKNIYVSTAKIQNGQDKISCGPISVELAMRLQAKFFFNPEKLVQFLRNNSRDRYDSMSLVQRRPSAVRKVDISGIRGLLDGDLKKIYTPEIRRKHRSFLDAGTANSNAVAQFISLVGDLADLMRGNPGQSDECYMQMILSTKEYSEKLALLRSEITKLDEDRRESESTTDEGVVDLVTTNPTQVQEPKKARLSDREKFLLLSVGCLSGVVVSAAVASVEQLSKIKHLKACSLVIAGVLCIASVVSLTFAITASPQNRLQLHQGLIRLPNLDLFRKCI